MRAIFDRTSTLSNGLMKHDEPSQSAEFFNAVKTADIIQPHKGSDLPADWKHSKPLSEAVAPQELGHAANFEKSAQKPRVDDHLTGECGRGGDDTPPGGGEREPDHEREALPVAVEMRGPVTSKGYQPENIEYFAELTETVKGKRAGRDPMTLSLSLLAAAGHPRRSPAAVKRALARVEDCSPEEIRTEGRKGWRGIRNHCLGCAANSAEVRRCQIIDCPAWPYRMGRNPHDTRRGPAPFAASETRTDA